MHRFFNPASAPPARGPTPPPPPQIHGAANDNRTPQQILAHYKGGSHFEDPSHFPAHFQAAAAPFQPPQQAYVEMNKPAGRVPGQGLAQTQQGFNVQRSQHQSYTPLVAESQDQQALPMWNPSQQNALYLAPGQNIRQQRMPAMNNGQVPGSGLAYMAGMPANMPIFQSSMAPGYNGNQGMPFVQNPNSQYMQYPQPRMPYHHAMQQQQQQMSFMPPFGPGYQSFYPSHMTMPNTSRPASAGPAAVGGPPKQQRNRKMLSLTDPNTGEDLTDKVFKSHPSDELDPNTQEVQAHREAVTLEFATKVAILAKDNKNPSEGSHAIQITPPAHVTEPSMHPVTVEEPQGAAMEPPRVVSREQPPMTEQQHPVINGEREEIIQEEVLSVEPPAPHTTPAKESLEATSSEAVETVAAASEVQTPSPALPAAPTMPQVDVAAPTHVPEKETSPTPVMAEPVVPEKEATPPAESATVMEATPLQTTVNPADSAKGISETSGAVSGSKQTPQQASAPQAQRQDGGRRNKKHKKDLNKKTKEGSDMDAFYDSQTSQENTTPSVSTPEKTTDAAQASVSEVAAPDASSEVTAAASGGASESVVEPAPQASPVVAEAVSPPPPQPEEVVAPPPQQAAPEVKVEEPAKAEPVKVPGENGEEAEPEVADGARPKQLLNGIQLNYKEGQWSPSNPEGKKQYDREFLLQLQANPESRKIPNLPDMPEIMIDPRAIKAEDFQKEKMMASTRGVPDFTPGFFKSYPTRSGGPGSMSKRGSQQGRRGGQGSQATEQRIIPSTRQEVTLHKSENAYKPLFQKEEKSGDEKETQSVLRQFKSILNKLTPEKYAKLAADVLQLSISDEERLSGVTDLIFEKAIAEPKFATQYANLCRDMLKLPKIEKATGGELTFRSVLLTKCQKEFEKENSVEEQLQARKKELANITEEKKKAQLMEELEEATEKSRRRYMGNTRFIGELYRLKMLTEAIMHDCIFKLLKLRDDDSIECLTKLLETIGQDLDHSKAKQRMDQYFAQLEKMVADMSGQQRDAAAPAPSQSKSKEGRDKLSTRVKFGVLDILDLRKNNWVKRKIHDQNKPTTLGEIHQKARQEQQEQQFLNSQPRMMDANPPPRGPKGKSRSSVQGDSDGWNTVPAKPVRQQIDATKMKITKTSVDETTLTLGGGNKFQNWGRGSQGGGSRSQEQEKSGNRYNALNSLNDSDGRRGGYGRSPARGDSRGGGRMGGDRDRDRDRDRRDRDRDFRKPIARSSMEERERAVASTRNLLGAGGPSNPSSRNASRDNSRSRDMPPVAAARVTSGVDVSRISADELNRRLSTIAQELLSNRNFKDAKESIEELVGLNYSQLVTVLLEQCVDDGEDVTKELLGKFLSELVKEKRLTVAALTEGMVEFMGFAEDLSIDIPHIWNSITLIFVGLFCDTKVLGFELLKKFLVDLKKSGRAAEIVARFLRLASQELTKEGVHQAWCAAGLLFSDFAVKQETLKAEFKWLLGLARNTVLDGVSNLMYRKASNEEVFGWIDRTCSKEDIESDMFVRELMRAICKSYISKQNVLDKEGLKARLPILHKYLDSIEKGTQALFAVQLLMCDLEHPQDVVRSTFDLLYDEDVISEESFCNWQKREGPAEDMAGKGAVLLSVRDFFLWLNNAQENAS